MSIFTTDRRTVLTLKGRVSLAAGAFSSSICALHKSVCPFACMCAFSAVCRCGTAVLRWPFTRKLLLLLLLRNANVMTTGAVVVDY